MWGRPPADVLSPRVLRSVVDTAEAAGFALVTIDDRVVPGEGAFPVGRLDAGTRASFVATTTSSIGVAPTVHALTTEPFHLATQLASLDHGSRGRAAWVVGSDNSADTNGAVGFEPRAPQAVQREVRDVIELARQLWDSWEDDAVIRDGATGRYLDPDKVHHVGFAGEFFSVVGPLITPRSPQGQIVVVGAAELGVTDLLDIVLLSAQDATEIGESAAGQQALTFADVEVILDTQTESAQSRLAVLEGYSPWPDRGRIRFAGSAPDFVDLVRSLVDKVDGVRIHPAVVTTDLAVLVDEVLPALQQFSLHRIPRPGSTLRETLGLPRPLSRFASTTS
ncbi:LLM class flavin-dependent oxidoreductase [Rhodococcus jostii]|uniref:LLM class flavin-dependent oxidoreductase n=1 Tax=Rhodococcus jostii TaxID=132919 RepID=UPI003660D2B4